MPVARECPSSTTLRIVDYASGNFSTDRRFTGQREEASLGFYDYGARPYDHMPSPALHEKFPCGFSSPPRLCREAV